LVVRTQTHTQERGAYDKQERTLAAPRGGEAQEAETRNDQVEDERQEAELDEHPNRTHQRQALFVKFTSPYTVNKYQLRPIEM
jgi:hypothetical protein